MNIITYAIVAAGLYFLWLVHLTVVAKRTNRNFEDCVFVAIIALAVCSAWGATLPLAMFSYSAYWAGSFVVKTIERREKRDEVQVRTD